MIVEYLKSKQIDVGNVVPRQEFAELGYRNGASIFADALSGAGRQLGIDEDLMEETGGFYHESDESMDFGDIQVGF